MYDKTIMSKIMDLSLKNETKYPRKLAEEAREVYLEAAGLIGQQLG